MERNTHTRTEAEWQQALELEKKLKACYRKRGVFDPEARGIRKQLRETYDSLLFLDAAFAAANDVELHLWKSVFYLPIEEFRVRIRHAEKEQGGNSAASAIPRANIPKIAAAFLKFLDDASVFYKRLVMQLQSAYGDVNVRLELPAGVSSVRGAATTDGANGMHCSTGSSMARDVRTSVHRCLVYLGDLSRYAAQAAPKAAAAAADTGGGGSNSRSSPAGSTASHGARSEWSRATSYYRLAAHVLPRSGNPHNQLAVMAFMTGDELKAVYHYARSLCVGVPFMTARENLLQLFQANRERYAQLLKQPHRQQQPRPQLSMQQQLTELGVCFVRLCGLLYDRINQHEYTRVAKDAFESLAAFLDHPALMQLLQRQKVYDCTPLHLVVLSIFMVHHTTGGLSAGGGGHHHVHQDPQQQQSSNGVTGRQHSSGGTGGLKTHAGGPMSSAGLPPVAAPAAPGTYGDAAQRGAQRSRALATLFRTGRLLSQAAAAAVNAEVAAATAAGAANGLAAAAASGRTGTTCLLVALNVLLQWLAAQPHFAAVHLSQASEEEVKARTKFWAAAGQLLSVLTDGGLQPGQQPPAAAASGSPGGGRAAASGMPSPGGGRAAAAAGAGASGSAGGDASCEGGALPEELELLGFEPLRSQHYWHVTDVGKHAVDECNTRVRRMLAAARVTSATLAAEQQQQQLRHTVAGSSSVSGQAIHQLGVALQQFIEAVAASTAGKPTPALGEAHAAGKSTHAAVVQLPEQDRSGQDAVAGQDGITDMDVDIRQPPPKQQKQQQPPDAAAAAEDIEEEVIVFRPRISRLSSPALDEVLPAAPAAAVASSAAQRPPTAGLVAEPPPLPHVLLASRQMGSPSVSMSPGSRSPVQQRPLLQQPVQQEEEQQPTPGGLVRVPRESAAAGPAGSRLQQQSRMAGYSTVADGAATATSRAGGMGVQNGALVAHQPVASAPAGGATAGGGGLLQGHAATALDLQQAQAASDMLLARLTAKQPLPAAIPAPGFGGSSSGYGAAASRLQQQQLQAPSSLSGQPSGAFPVSAGTGGGEQLQLDLALVSQPPSPRRIAAQAVTAEHSLAVVGQHGLLGRDLSGLLGVPPDGFGRQSTADGLADIRLDSSLGFSLGGVGDTVGTSDALAAVNAAVAASMALAEFSAQPGQQLQLPGTLPGNTSANMGMMDSLAALGALNMPANSSALLLGQVPGMPAAAGGALMHLEQLGQPGSYMPGVSGLSNGIRPGFTEFGLVGVQHTAGGAGLNLSAPVSINQQQRALAVLQDEQQQLSSSYQMAATAMDAANRVLSPEQTGAGLALMQEHHLQQQRLQQQKQQQQQQMVSAAQLPMGSNGLSSFHSRGGSWLSGSTSSTPRATTPRAGALTAAIQQQQQQQHQLLQLQADMAQRRLSGGGGSPSAAQAVGAERTLSDGRPTRASLAGATAITAGGGMQQHQQPVSSIGAMFGGPGLFTSSDQLPPVAHRRASSGSMPPTPAPGRAAVPLPEEGGAGHLLPSVLGDVVGFVPDDPAPPDAAVAAAAGALQPHVGADPSEGGLTLVEYLTQQQHKLQQQQQQHEWTCLGGMDGGGLDRLPAPGPPPSVLLPPLDMVESQNPYG